MAISQAVNLNALGHDRNWGTCRVLSRSLGDVADPDRLESRA